MAVEDGFDHEELFPYLNKVDSEDDRQLGHDRYVTDFGDYNVFVVTENLSSQPNEYPVIVEGPAVEVDSNQCMRFGEIVDQGYVNINLEPADIELASMLGETRRSSQSESSLIGTTLDESDYDQANVHLVFRDGFDEVETANEYVESAIETINGLYEEAREESSQ